LGSLISPNSFINAYSSGKTEKLSSWETHTSIHVGIKEFESTWNIHFHQGYWPEFFFSCILV
jgi:hypothetical protein